MRYRGRRRAVLVLAITGLLMLGLPASMAFAAEVGTSSAPTNLRQTGTDAWGLPVLQWERTQASLGHYEVRYSPRDGQSFGATSSGSASSSSHATVWDWLGYCLEGGDYAVQVRYVAPNGQRSNWSNPIEAELPELF